MINIFINKIKIINFKKSKIIKYIKIKLKMIFFIMSIKLNQLLFKPKNRM